MDSFGVDLRQERLRAGWYQWQLARVIGVTEKTVSNYELEKSRPPVSVLRKTLVAFPSIQAAKQLLDKKLAAAAGVWPRLPKDKQKDIYQLVNGSMLGDGHIQFVGANARFMETHGNLQREYLLVKAEIVAPFGVKVYSRKSGEICICTRVDPFFTGLYTDWYPHGRKRLPVQHLWRLNARGLAFWYMDDGTYINESACCTLATLGFRYSENKTMASYFSKIWGISPAIYRGRAGKCRLWFHVGDSEELLKIVYPHVINLPCMRYKLGHLCASNMRDIEMARERKRERGRGYIARAEVKARMKKYQRAYYIRVGKCRQMLRRLRGEGILEAGRSQ